MTTPDPSASLTSQPTAASVSESPVYLPSGETAAHSTRPAGLFGRRMGSAVLIFVAVLFAFLCASYPVRNSDFWLHLAGGRLLADGRYQFGVDPFTYTSGPAYWVNHAWLFDWLLYEVHQHLGDTLLVLGKAALIALLAALMLLLRRRAVGFALPVVGTLLALLALTPYLLLRSTLLSYVFFGLTLWLLWRPRRGASTWLRDGIHYAPLLLLFVIWVNFDSWFLLGPVAAGLFWLGDRLRPEATDGESMRRTPIWLWLAGLAVCLVNPHHIHAFRLPVELMPLPAALSADPRWDRTIATPWQQSWVYHPLTGVHLANAAYFALLALGLLSFVTDVRRAAGWRLLIWLGLAGLSSWRISAIPFFAVAAGPILVLNFQDIAPVGGTRPGLFFPALRFGVVLGGLALSLLAWTGWLQGFQDPALGRRVDWRVQPDGSLRRVAETIARWREPTGPLRPEERVFALHPQVVHYCAWFCPEEKAFFDLRPPMSAATADEYEEVCRALLPDLAPKDRKSTGDWRKILRAHNVTHVILYDPSLRRITPAVMQMAGGRSEWTLLHLDGQALILGWNDAGRPRRADEPVFDAERVAFAPSESDQQMLPPPPEAGPERGPRLASDWRALLAAPAPPPSWEADAAGVLYRYFEGVAPSQVRRRAQRCISWATALTAAPLLAQGALDGAVRLATELETAPLTPGDLGQISPATPLLAIRAARRALAENPDDVRSYLNLGRAYYSLAMLTPERVVLGPLQPLGRLRHIQIAAALENALRRDPDLREAHEALATLYRQRNYLDAALEHLRAALRLRRRLIRRSSSAPDAASAFAKQLDQMEKDTRELERAVGELKYKLPIQLEKISEPFAKAQLAVRMGLPHYALNDILLPSPIVLLDAKGIRLQMQLLLELGEIDAVRAQLRDPDWQANKNRLGYEEVPVFSATPKPKPYQLAAYDWLLLCQSAADGDYGQVRAALQSLREDLGGQSIGKTLEELRSQLPSKVVREVAAHSDPLNWIVQPLTSNDRLGTSIPLQACALVVVTQADLRVLAGLLDLELGDIGAAEKSFTEALSLSELGSDIVQPAVGTPLAKEYLRILRRARAAASNR